MSEILQGPRPAFFRNQYWSGGGLNSSGLCQSCMTILMPGDPIITKSTVENHDHCVLDCEVIVHLCRQCGIKFANEAGQIVYTRNPSTGNLAYEIAGQDKP